MSAPNHGAVLALLREPAPLLPVCLSVCRSFSLSVCLPSHCAPSLARARLEAFSDHSGKLQVPLQEIIDWLGQKDEELSAQLPLRGDVLLVQQEKETHAVSSLCLPFAAVMGWGWAALPGTPAHTTASACTTPWLSPALLPEKRQSPSGFRQ